MVYLHPFQYIYAVRKNSSGYFTTCCKNQITIELNYFSNRSDYATISALEQSESEILENIVNEFLWEVSQLAIDNDHKDCIDCKWQVPDSIYYWESFKAFTVCGSTSIIKDFESFRSHLSVDMRFSSHGMDFHVDVDKDKYTSSLVVYQVIPEIFVDEESGEKYIIDRTYKLLPSCRTMLILYAKFRTALFHHLIANECNNK